MKRAKNGIVSFDVSSVSTGWSYLVRKNLKKFGVIQPPKKFSTGQKLYYFNYAVESILKMCKPSHVVIEETYLKNVKTLKNLMQFIGVANLNCMDVLEIDPFFANILTVRSKFRIRSKEEAFELIKALYKPRLDDYSFEEGNDITDSILQALYYYEYVLNTK